jgi:hypothetical protein
LRAGCCRAYTSVMITPIIRRLTQARATAAKLEQSFVKELASRPKAYGFDSLGAFVAAVEASGRGKRRAKKARRPSKPKTRKRAVITDPIRAKVKALLKAGKSGSQIAKAVGISLPSVHNVKKVLGLVKKSKKAPPKAKRSRASSKPTAKPKTHKKWVAPKKATIPDSKPATTTIAPTVIPAV